MQSLLRNIRFYVLLFSVLLSGILFLWVRLSIVSPQTQNIRLEQIYSFVALFYLYITLLAGPFCYRFRKIPFRALYIKSRRAFGVAVFYFAFLHTIIALFGQMGGFAGLGFLSSSFLFAIILGFVALLILFLLTVTSFDYFVTKMRFKKWKLLHRLVYLGGILILIHALLLGTHYSNLSSVIPQITFFALLFLFILEEPRIFLYFSKKNPESIIAILIRSVIASGIILLIIFFIVTTYFTPTNGGVSFDIHAVHRQLALQAIQDQTQQKIGNFDISKIPGLNGDRAKRYTVSMSTDPENPTPNQDVTIRFKVYDADSGNRISLFRIVYAKPMHLIIVNSNLTYFTHLHPTQENQDFVITTQFPQDDLYHIYIQFQPFGGIEQQMAFTLPVGQVPQPLKLSESRPDIKKTKTYGEYTVSVNTHGNLDAQALSVGQQVISITVKNAKTKKPVTNLKPYLASFGHLTMINEKTFDFIHVHPYSFVIPPPNANGGPTVDFLPIGIYGPFKPGIYRAFAEFNPNNTLFTADFTVKIN